MGSVQAEREDSFDQSELLAPDKGVPAKISRLVNFTLENELTEISLDSSKRRSHYPISPGGFGATVAVDEKRFVYVTGGTRNRYVVNDAHKLNLLYEPPHWERLPPMNEARIYHGMIAIQGVIMVFGGRNRNGFPLHTGEYYRSGIDWWSIAPNMNRLRACFPLLLHDCCIYALGGMGKKLVPQASCEKFPMKTSQVWEFVRRMPSAKISATAVAVKGAIFVIGGFPHDHTTVEKYFVATNTWLKIRALKIKRQCFAACSVGDVIYVGGGDELPLEAYDTSRGRAATWEVQIGLPKGIRHNSLIELEH